MLWCSVLLCVATSIIPTYSARILAIVPTPSYSHQIIFFPLWRELSLRGHQVTLLTTDPLRDPSLTNLTEIDCSSSYKIVEEYLNFNELIKVGPMETFERYLSTAHHVAVAQLEHPMLQQLLKSETERFDVVLVEGKFPSPVAFAIKYNCPLIQILSLDISQYYYHKMGNPSHPVLNPDSWLKLAGKLNFFDRIKSVVLSLVMNYYNTRVIDSQNKLVQKYFGNDYPHLDEILSKTSMWFVNTDTVLHPIRPLLPNIIQIGGGMHLKSNKPLPKDLQKVLDNSPKGIIYFSLGNNVKSKLLSQERRKLLMETFAELPYTILWKFEQEDLPDKPDNVIISKWFPQQDVLRHPNIKLFITQGGLQSMEEAIYNHVPIIGMPFFGDQLYNMKRMVPKGVGLSLDFTTMDKDAFKLTILEVINNPKYRNRVKELAELLKDQPMTGLERAIWWTEYVIRHKGAKHLRSPAKDLPDYQYFLLDVIGFCILVSLIAIYILVNLIKLTYRLFRYVLFVRKLKTD